MCLLPALCCAALRCVQACQSIRRLLGSPSDRRTLSRSLFAVTEILLTAHAAAVAAAPDARTKADLLGAYREARAACLPALLEDALWEWQGQGAADGGDEDGLIWCVGGMSRYYWTAAACLAVNGPAGCGRLWQGCCA